MLLSFEFRGLRKGPGRPQKLDFELFRAVFEHFRALFGLENGPPEPPGKHAKTGPRTLATGPEETPEHTLDKKGPQKELQISTVLGGPFGA